MINKIIYFEFFFVRDAEKIRDGIAEKVSHFLCLMVGFVICVALSFYYGWKLTLVVIGYVPILLVTNMIVSRVSENIRMKLSKIKVKFVVSNNLNC